MTRPRWPLIVASGPVVCLALAWATLLVMGVFGANPVWRVEPINLGEAAALRDRGEVARLLSDGADPYATYVLRAGFLYQNPAQLTPLAAAVAANRPEIVQVLADSGVAIDRDSWARSWCEAADDEMRRVLEPLRPQEVATPSCDEGDSGGGGTTSD